MMCHDSCSKYKTTTVPLKHTEILTVLQIAADTAIFGGSAQVGADIAVVAIATAKKCEHHARALEQTEAPSLHI